MQLLKSFASVILLATSLSTAVAAVPPLLPRGGDLEKRDDGIDITINVCYIIWVVEVITCEPTTVTVPKTTCTQSATTTVPNVTTTPH
ncbi:hypothetical protein CEP53_001553 [Fusarium sp. AF-6]|nr:hypothetical protein CEP53_001553 [Fusarium sp. AF-6]